MCQPLCHGEVKQPPANHSPFSPGVQSSCLSKVSRGTCDASGCTKDPHEAGAEMGHVWDLYPSRAASNGAFKTPPDACVFHASAEIQTHILTL